MGGEKHSRRRGRQGVGGALVYTTCSRPPIYDTVIDPGSGKIVFPSLGPYTTISTATRCPIAIAYRRAFHDN